VKEPFLGRRICVVGTSGSGKTSVARALAERLDIPYISNDAIIWAADWQSVPRAERVIAMRAATDQPAWTFDGNLGPTSEDRVVLERCDSIVWLDLPRWQVHTQVLGRTLRRLAARTELWHGNRERVRTLFSRDSIVWWSIKTFATRRREYRALFDHPAYSDRIRVRLRSRDELRRWLDALPGSQPMRGTHSDPDSQA
jgi:adenylate kinase family enzyme